MMKDETPRTVECESHGRTNAAYLCQHLVRGAHLGFCVPDFSPDEEPSLEAWCNSCDRDLEARGWVWDDVSEENLGLTLVCSECFELSRRRNASYSDTLHAHVHQFFDGHLTSSRTWAHGPILEVAPNFHVIVVEPGPKAAFWTYVSVGAGLQERSTKDAGPLEFIVIAPNDDDRAVEDLAMATHYHLTKELGLGHTVPLGRAWRPGSQLDHLLVCKPYPLGPDLERFKIGDTHGHILWLMPITSAESTYRHAHGLEALEAMFDRAGFDAADPMRGSAV